MRFDVAEHLAAHTEFRERSGHSGPQLNARVCPYCGDDNWHLYVNAKTGLWKCFKCGEGDARTYVHLIAKYMGASLSEALAVLRDAPPLRAPAHGNLGKLRAALDSMSFDTGSSVRLVDAPLPGPFVPCWDGKRWRIPSAVKRRRFARETLREFGIGYCLIGTYARRIIIPIRTGAERAFQARAFDADVHGPKYLSPDVDMGRLLFGEPLLAAGTDEVVVVEGAFDAMRLHEYGLRAVALFGKSVSDRQASIIADRARAAVVMLDADDPGAERVAWDSAARLASLMDHVRVARPPAGKDPDTSTREEAERALREALASAEPWTVARRRLAALRSY